MSQKKISQIKEKTEKFDKPYLDESKLFQFIKDNQIDKPVEEGGTGYHLQEIEEGVEEVEEVQPDI